MLRTAKHGSPAARVRRVVVPLLPAAKGALRACFRASAGFALASCRRGQLQGSGTAQR